ncbi:hypothetical protein D915_010423 [Fasciola hepatica]|uniref:Uncharacterized protein n=1 Tax=Fasciola hepatica TaxID=6192 RepID=A0A4E0QUK3_FASHE|nr:hypothetical protein D915_010423 [Fasciola hepatica]
MSPKHCSFLVGTSGEQWRGSSSCIRCWLSPSDRDRKARTVCTRRVSQSQTNRLSVSGCGTTTVGAGPRACICHWMFGG